MLNSKKRVISSYYHPTTAVFLDDHRAYLNSIPLALDNNIAYKAFSAPDSAIQYINDRPQEDQLIEKHDFSVHGNTAYHYKLNSSYIQSKAMRSDRFAEPSVLITDYSLANHDTNGLEVCQSIANPHIKKILLTGVADEQIAIDALNNKVIDYYIKKSTPDVFRVVNQLIHQYQHDYILETTRVIRESVKINKPLIADPVVVEYFHSLLSELQVSEYQILLESSASSLDFLLLNHHGEMSRLLLLESEDLGTHLEVAQDAHAPEELMNAIKSAVKIPFFPTEDGFYHPDLKTSWQNHLYDCTTLVGEKTYFAALISGSQFAPISPSQITSFHDYLHTANLD